MSERIFHKVCAGVNCCGALKGLNLRKRSVI